MSDPARAEEVPPGFEALLRRRDRRLVARDEAHVTDPSRLVHVRTLPARGATYGTTKRPIHPEVAARIGVDRLWSHQAQAIDALADGRSVVVATGTCSGKSLVAQVAIGEAILGLPPGRDPQAEPAPPGTALCLYPTKALAHDQLRALRRLDLPDAHVATYDGDTGRDERSAVRRDANVVLTNPEMLHYGILPHHAAWAGFLARLRVVFIDELHLFRGIFGSHVAHVVRRLRRLAAHYGAEPVFVTASATVGRPAELAGALTGVAPVAVVDDGSPCAERVVAIWNPPVIDPDDGVRSSAHTETAGLLAEFVAENRRAIAFCASRRTTEIVAERARRQVRPARRSRITAYRGGYLAEERHRIEDDLAGGRLDAVVATSALEVGLDLDGVDVTVLDGFPGTIASFWQRTGRAGRRNQPALGVLVCGADQLDQWISTHPDALFDRAPEPAVVNPANPFVADPHLRCAAFELPLTHDDERFWPGLLDDSVRRLVGDGELVVRPPGAGTAGGRGRRRRTTSTSPVGIWNGSGWPVDRIGLRSSSPGQVTIVDEDGAPVGTVDRSRAPEVVHPGASYLHAGAAFRVVELDLDARRAVVEPDDGTTTTTPTTRLDLRLGRVDRTSEVGPPGARIGLGLGAITVTTRVTGYTRTELATGDVVERVGLRMPPSTLETRGVWRVVPETLLASLQLDPERWPGILHAAEHAAIGVLPLFAICDRWDVGGISTARHPDTGAPTIVIYDGQPGGAGIAELGYDVAESHIEATADVVAGCGCVTGCPSCVQSPKCGNGNDPLDKAGAAVLLAALVGRSVPEDRAEPVRTASRAG